MPQAIRDRDYPEGIDPEKAQVILSLQAGLTGDFGETHLVSHDGALLALTRASSVDPLEVHPLADAPPTVEPGRWGSEQLVLTTGDGKSQRLELSHSDRPVVLKALEALYRATGAWAELCALLERELAGVYDAKQQLALRSELAEIYEQHLDEPGRALEYYRLLYQERPSPPVIAALARLAAAAGEDRSSEQAARLLEQHYRARREWEPLVGLLYRLAEGLPAGAERAAALLEIAAIVRQKLNDPARALIFAGRALAEDPASDEALLQVDRLAEHSRRWAEAAILYQAAEDETDDPERAAELLWRTAEAHRRAEQHDEAVGAYNELLLHSPEHRPALRALDQLYTEAECWADLAECLRRQIELTLAPSAQQELLQRLGRLCEEQLADPAAALAAYRRSVTIAPADMAAWEAIARLTRAAESWAELLDALAALIQLCSTDEQRQVELSAEAARLAEEQLSDAARAVELWRKVLALQPGQAAALAALERLLTELERWRELCTILEHHADLVGDPVKEQALRKRAGLILAEQLSEPIRAIAAFERALEIDARDHACLQALEPLYAAAEDHEQLLRTWQRLLPLAADEAEKRQLHVWRAELLADTLGRIDDSIAEWQQVQALAPHYPPAVDALIELCRRAERYGEAVSYLELKLAQSTEDKEAIPILLEIAALQQQLSDPAAAVATYRKVIERAPRQRVAFERAVELLRGLGDHEQLIGLYEQRARAVKRRKMELRLQAARICYESLRDAPRAVALLHPSLKRGFQHEGFMKLFTLLGTEGGAWQQTFESLEQLLGKVGEKHNALLHKRLDELVEALLAAPALKVHSCELLLRCAAHYRERRGQPKRALALYRQALSRQPDSLVALEWVRELLRQLGRHRDLAAHLRQMSERPAFRGRAREQLLRQLIELHERELDEPEQAAALQKQLRPSLVPYLLIVALLLGGLVLVLLYARGLLG